MGSVNPIFILEFGDCEYANVQGESTGKVYAAHRERELRRKIWKDVEYMKQVVAKAAEYRVDSFEICAE